MLTEKLKLRKRKGLEKVQAKDSVIVRQKKQKKMMMKMMRRRKKQRQRQDVGKSRWCKSQ